MRADAPASHPSPSSPVTPVNIYHRLVAGPEVVRNQQRCCRISVASHHWHAVCNRHLHSRLMLLKDAHSECGIAGHGSRYRLAIISDRIKNKQRRSCIGDVHALVLGNWISSLESHGPQIVRGVPAANLLLVSVAMLTQHPRRVLRFVVILPERCDLREFEALCQQECTPTYLCMWHF